MEEGKGKCFVMMPFDKVYRQDFFLGVIQPLAALYGLECMIADQHKGDIYGQIEAALKLSSLCIADISIRSSTGGKIGRPNVMYELGAAHALKKHVILIAQNGTELPFAVGRWKVVFYNNPEELRKLLLNALNEVVESDPSRICLVPDRLRKEQHRFVVAASPRSWQHGWGKGKQGGFSELTAVGGDMLIAARLLDRLSRFGLDALSVNPGDYRPQVLYETPMNLYCIGGTLANKWTRMLLDELAKHWAPRLRFDSEKTSRVRIRDGQNRELFKDISPNFERDVGLVIRAPNPFHPQCMVMILAGRRVTGTEASYYALDNPDCLAKLLDCANLDDYQQAFWMAVEMSRYGQPQAYRPDLDSLKVLQVKRFRKRYRPAKWSIGL